MGKDNDDIVSIHTEALKQLFTGSRTSLTANDNGDDDDPELALLQQRLAYLRTRRLELHSNIKQVEFEQQLRPLSDDLVVARGPVSGYQHVFNIPSPPASNSSPSKRRSESMSRDGDNYTATNDSTTADLAVATTVSSITLAERMQHLRKRRRIVGSHRIAGVSIIPVPSDRNVLGIRLDVCIMGGTYVAKHLLFFDVVASVDVSGKDDDDDNDESDDAQEDAAELKHYSLRLNQHTLPPSVTLPKLIQKHFGGSTLLALPEGGSLTTNVLTTVRELVGDIHDACHAHAVRKAGVEFLKKYVVPSSNNILQHDHQGKLGHFCVSNLNFPDTFRHIDFEVAWRTPANCRHNGMPQKLVIKLEFGEECDPQPTNVKVSTVLQNGSNDIALKHKSIKLLQSMPLWKFFAGLQAKP